MRDGWRLEILGEISEVIMGRQLSPSKKLGTRPRPYIRAANIGSWGISLNEIFEMDFTEDEEARFASQIGDTLLVEGGNEKSVGCPGLVTENEAGLCIQNTVIRCRVKNPEVFHPEFQYQVLRYMYWRRDFAELCAGTTIMHLGQKRAELVPILLPPLAEQKRIVDLISSVDSYIEALQQQLDSVRSASNAHFEKIVSVFSDDWREVTLGEVLEISRGGSPRPIQEYLTNSEDGINWVKIADATRSEKYIYSTLQKIKREGISRSREVFAGDFILSNSMSFGRPYIMRTDGCIHDGWLLLSKVSSNFDEDFLYNLLNSDYVQRQFESLAAGSGVRNLNIEVVKKVKVKIPSIHVQKELASVINEFENFIIKLTKQLHSGLDLRNALLSDLLSGEHEIPASYDKVIGAA